MAGAIQRPGLGHGEPVMVGTVTFHEMPKTAEEVDFDRLVWDPVYREAVRHLIEGDGRSDKDEGGKAPKERVKPAPGG